MKITRAQKCTNITISHKEWCQIGTSSGWIKEASGEIYLLDKGVLYDDDAEEVFNMKSLIKYFDLMKEMKLKTIPKFYDAAEANEFLMMFEEKSGASLGRVLEKHEDPRETIRYKDTKKERDEAKMDYIDKRNNNIQRGIL